MSESNALVPIPVTQENATEYFKPNGLQPILTLIQSKIDEFAPDITTDEGRKQIASMARKVSSSKVIIDDIGKELVGDIKKQATEIDAERKRARDYLDALRDSTRQPLTEWEEAEERRVAKHKEKVAAIAVLTQLPIEPSVADLERRLNLAAELRNHDFEEFTELATPAIDEAEAALRSRIVTQKKIEADRAEIEQLRADKAARDAKDREEQMRKDAEEKARNDLAEQTRKQQEESDRRVKKAEDDATEAVERERARVAADQKREDDATASREKDKKHRAKINNEALDGIIASCGKKNLMLSAEAAKAIIEAIAKGQVPNITIKY